MTTRFTCVVLYCRALFVLAVASRLQQCERDARVKLPLKAQIVKPAQRIPRYELLLKVLISSALNCGFQLTCVKIDLIASVYGLLEYACDNVIHVIYVLGMNE